MPDWFEVRAVRELSRGGFAPQAVHRGEPVSSMGVAAKIVLPFTIDVAVVEAQLRRLTKVAWAEARRAD